MTQVKRQIHLAAHFPGVNSMTVWSDPQAGSHIDVASFVHLAQTAERAKFDFFFLAEGLRMREHASRLHELDVAAWTRGRARTSSNPAVTSKQEVCAGPRGCRAQVSRASRRGGLT